MGTVLYMPGSTYNIRGVDCDLKVFEDQAVSDALETGWSYSPKGCYVIPEKADDILELEPMADNEIRMIAKEKGISHWHNKSIDRLKEEVDTWQPED